MENTTVNMIDTTEHTGKNNTMVLTMCGVETMDRCYTQYGFKYTVVILNIISVFVNISHIRILRRMATSNSATYMFVLQLISAADLQSTLHMFTCFCSIHELFVGQHIYYAAALAAIMSHSGLVKYASLATASIERYLSLCHPLYGTLRCDRFCSRLTQIKITADRKSTRLNSSHQIISYAVFCLKKKTKKNTSHTFFEDNTTNTNETLNNLQA